MQPQANVVGENEQVVVPQTETVSKTDYEALRKQVDDLTANNKALQRTLHNERQRGGTTQNLERKLQANEELLVGIVETLGKMGVEGVDTSTYLNKYRETTKESQDSEREQTAASTAIVGAFSAAGIPSEEFEATWLSEERFAKAREAYTSGKFSESVAETVRVFSMPKELTPEKVQEMINEAVAKDRQSRAAEVPAGRESSGGGANITYDEWKKLPVSERIKHDYKSSMRKSNG